MEYSDTDVDSRWYRFGFSLSKPEDAPRDFPIPQTASIFSAAFFMPGESHSSYDKGIYPPRIFTLSGDEIAIYAHPSSEESPFIFRIPELISIESAKLLLFGYIKFQTETSTHLFRYNVVEKRYMDSFLACVRDLWLAPERTTGYQTDNPQFENLTLRFRYALKKELDPQEEYQAHVYLEVKNEHRGKSLFRSSAHARQQISGDMLILTNRRLLWITNRIAGMHESYGYIARYIPHRRVKSFVLERDATASTLTCNIDGGEPWNIIVPNDYAVSAEEFSTDVMRGIG